MSLIEFQIIAPWSILLIFMATFIMTVSVMIHIDWAKFFKKELQTPIMGILLTLIVSLVVTFCIGSLLIVLASCMVNFI